MHYPTIKEAKTKWNRRAAKINYSNIIEILFENETTTEQMLKEFDELNFPHCEMMFNEYSGLKNAFYNERVSHHVLHHWKPEWVMETRNWTKVLNEVRTWKKS